MVEPQDITAKEAYISDQIEIDGYEQILLKNNYKFTDPEREHFNKFFRDAEWSSVPLYYISRIILKRKSDSTYWEYFLCQWMADVYHGPDIREETKELWSKCKEVKRVNVNTYRI